MNDYTQLRCLVASATLHAGLVAVIALMALVRKPPAPPAPPQTYVILLPTDTSLTSGPSGGGELPASPPERVPPPATPALVPPTAVPQNLSKPPPTQPVVIPKPPKNVVTTPPRPTPQLRTREPEPLRPEPNHRIEVSTTRILTTSGDLKKRQQAEKTAREDEAKEAARAAKDRMAQIEARNRAERERYERTRREAMNDAINGLKSALAGTTKIEIPGPGGGGAVTANYAEYVQTVFQASWNRNRPAALAARSAQSRVSLTISRDGSFTTRVITAARVAEVDDAIGRILTQQGRLRPFPADLKADDLEIIITFDLRSLISG